MNLQKLKEEITADEGRVNFVYSDIDGKPTWPGRKIIDSKTKKLVNDGNPTFGIGHKLTPKDAEWTFWKSLKPGGKLSISEKRIDEVFDSDIKICLEDCGKIFPDFKIRIEELQHILANMMFNLGYGRFSGFEKFIINVKATLYLDAASEMRNSKWYNQVTNRAERLRKRMMKLATPILNKISLTKEECENVVAEKVNQLT